MQPGGKFRPLGREREINHHVSVGGQRPPGGQTEHARHHMRARKHQVARHKEGSPGRLTGVIEHPCGGPLQPPSTARRAIRRLPRPLELDYEVRFGGPLDDHHARFRGEADTELRTNMIGGRGEVGQLVDDHLRHVPNAGEAVFKGLSGRLDGLASPRGPYDAAGPGIPLDEERFTVLRAAR